MAPLGLPVVPPVYCSSATSSTSTAGHCRGSFLAPVRAELVEAHEARRIRDRRGRDGRRAEGRVVADDQVIEETVALQLLRQRQHEADVGGDEDARARVLQLVRKLPLGIERREVHDAPAGLERAEEREGVVGRIRQVEGNRRARTDAQLHQAGSDRLDAGAQLGIARLAVTVFERRLGGPLRGERIEQRRQRRRLDGCVPAHAGRVALLPGSFRSHCRPCCWRSSSGTIIVPTLGVHRGVGNKLTYRAGT